MAKRLQITLISLLMSVCAIASDTSVKNADGVDIWYDFDKSTKTASVTCKGHFFLGKNSYHTRKIVIPSKVIYQGAEYSVTEIGWNAFRGCSSLTSVTIPESVTEIGGDAFYGTALYNTESNWDNNVLYIDNCLIKAKDIISGEYIIKNGTKLIGGSAFRGCSSLTSVTIPESVTWIGWNAFSGCSSLTSVTIPESVTEIGGDAFYGTALYNTESNWDNNVLYIDNCLIKAKDNISGEYIIKNGTRLKDLVLSMVVVLLQVLRYLRV